MKIKCNCKTDGRGNTQGADFQNVTYGAGIRIATQKVQVSGGPPEYRCTVCGTSHNHEAAVNKEVT